MPMRFSTQAANADILGDDAENKTRPEGAPQPAADDAQRGRGDRAAPRAAGAGENRSGGAEDGEAKPGKDINAASFIKDKDASKP